MCPHVAQNDKSSHYQHTISTPLLINAIDLHGDGMYNIGIMKREVIFMSTHAEEKRRESKPFFTSLCTDPQFQRNTALAASALQLFLLFTMYFIALRPLSLMIFALPAAVIFLLYRLERKRVRDHEPGSGRIQRVLRHIIAIAATAVPLVIFATLTAFFLYTNEPLNVTGLGVEYSISLLVATMLLPILLMIQAALSVCIKSRCRFDLVLMRITSIVVFLATLSMCVFILDLKLEATSLSSAPENFITTIHPFSFSMLGMDIDFTIAIDNILTRILLCGSGALSVIASFLLKPSTDSPRI